MRSKHVQRGIEEGTSCALHLTLKDQPLLAMYHTALTWHRVMALMSRIAPSAGTAQYRRNVVLVEIEAPPFMRPLYVPKEVEKSEESENLMMLKA